MKAGVLKIRAGDEKLRLGTERSLYGLKIARINPSGESLSYAEASRSYLSV
jgi:hypothetical protein